MAAVLAAAPPRKVPAGLRRAAAREACPPSAFLLSALVFTMGVFLAAIDSPKRVFQDLELNHFAVRTVGSIVSIQETRYRVRTHAPFLGFEMHPRSADYRYDFVFSVPGGPDRVQGTCYTIGPITWSGAPVNVEYLAARPSVARIAGTHLDDHGYKRLVPLLMPAMGIALAGVFYGSRRRAVRLLTHGNVAEANVTGCEPLTTGKKVRRMAYLVTLRPTDNPNGEPWRFTTSDPEVMTFAASKLKSKQPVFVVYHPKRYQQMLLPECFVS